MFPRPYIAENTSQDGYNENVDGEAIKSAVNYIKDFANNDEGCRQAILQIEAAINLLRKDVEDFNIQWELWENYSRNLRECGLDLLDCLLQYIHNPHGTGSFKPYGDHSQSETCEHCSKQRNMSYDAIEKFSDSLGKFEREETINDEDGYVQSE